MSSTASVRLSQGCVDFIDDHRLMGLLHSPEPEDALVEDVLAKSRDKQPLSVEETSVLLGVRDADTLGHIMQTARDLKTEVYGNRIVLFAPLYVNSECVNDCLYCGFRRSNPDAARIALGPDELRQQVEALLAVGHKRLILVYGEHPKSDADFIAQTVQLVYGTEADGDHIRRVNVNAAPLDVEGYRTVKAAGIGTYQVFQETYHHGAYGWYHPASTRKGDYLYRIDALSRAMEGGVDDVGIGALFGLFDWRFEVLGLVAHALHLQSRFGVGPHTISFPRLRPASGVSIDDRFRVTDDQFKHIVATLRLAVPYTGLICTARESAEVRREALALGVSQIDAGSNIELGGYGNGCDHDLSRAQFELADERPLDDVMRELLVDGYIPSFCTACYRLGRTGEHFMEFAIPGFIKRFCTPNALTTLMEYLVDYASPSTRAAGEALIDRELASFEDGAMKRECIDRLERIRTTLERDLYL